MCMCIGPSNNTSSLPIPAKRLSTPALMENMSKILFVSWSRKFFYIRGEQNKNKQKFHRKKNLFVPCCQTKPARQSSNRGLAYRATWNSAYIKNLFSLFSRLRRAEKMRNFSSSKKRVFGWAEWERWGKWMRDFSFHTRRWRATNKKRFTYRLRKKIFVCAYIFHILLYMRQRAELGLQFIY